MTVDRSEEQGGAAGGFGDWPAGLDDDALLSPAQVAGLWGCSSRTVRRRISDGVVPAVRFSRSMVKIRAGDARAVARGEKPARVNNVLSIDRRSTP